jgi:hypothetical protein
MTKAQAATVVSALINAGYAPTIAIRESEYVVTVYTDENGATAAAVQGLATNNGVQVRVRGAEYF